MAEPHTDPATPTREHLLDVAETLFLEQGTGVSLRAIVREAGQRNQSALQYHFGNRDGLITALVDRRQEQVEARRAELVRKALTENKTPDLREICALQVRPVFLLCREQASFRDALGLLGQRLLSSDRRFLEFEINQNAPSLFQLWQMALDQIDDHPLEVLSLRVENSHGMALLAMSRRAKQKDSFKGRRAELFFNNLVDQLLAMLTTPISDETRSQL